MRKITKNERLGIIWLLAGIVLFAFLTTPIDNLVGQYFNTDMSRIIVGFILLILIAYFGRLNNIK